MLKNIFFFLCPFVVLSQTIWTGPTIDFTKENNADFTQEQNQDRITDYVWLTRGDNDVLFNIKTETSAFSGSSPQDTKWAEGTTENLSGLTFTNFKGAAPVINGSSKIKNMVGKHYVLHLISENIYIDVLINSWQPYNNGGGFSYTRSTNQNLGFSSSEKKLISVYPNPTTGLVSVNSPLVSQILVYDLTGKQVLNSNASSVDLSAFKNGVYLLKLFRKDTKNWITKRIIKYQMF
jgi:hypothetical protein